MKNIFLKSLSAFTILSMVFSSNIALANPNQGNQVLICHATESESNPYNVISVDEEGLNGHGDHEDDIIPITDLNGDQSINDADCVFDGNEDNDCDQNNPSFGSDNCDEDEDEDNDSVCEEGNLIENGGFESPDVGTGGWTIYPDGTSGLAWDVAWKQPSGAPDVANLEIHDSLWTPVVEGTQYAELDTDFGDPAGGAASVTITQTIPTVIGDTYTIGYDFSPRSGTDASQNILGVWVNGVQIDTHAADGSANPGNAWTHFENEFTATTSSTTISFDDQGTPDSLGTLIDNVSVDCNPGDGDGGNNNNITIVANKIVCDEESMLPNWGLGGPDIGATTASNWVGSHEGCHLVENWQFEWAKYGTDNPGDSDVGTTGGDWHAFTGSVNIPIPTDSADNTKLWIREVMQDGYIPFEGADNSSDVSAEIYCHSDVLNYDNYERIDGVSAGGTYNCVAWNVATEPDGPSCDSPAIWARVFVTDFTNGGSGDMTNKVYVGNNVTPINSGEWFMVYDGVNYINDATLYEDVPGVAVQRLNGKVLLGLHGSHPETVGNQETVDGYVEFFNGAVTSAVSDVNQNKLETVVASPDSASPDSVWVVADKAYFDLNVNTADDFFFTNYEFEEDESCNPTEDDGPSCASETIWARVIVTTSNTGAGNASDTIYLGSPFTTVASGEWFDTSIIDANDIDTFANIPGIAVQRKAGQIVLELHGSQTSADVENADGYIEFWNGVPTLQTSATGQDVLENLIDHPSTGHPDPVWIVADKSHFDLAVTTEDDRFTTNFSYQEDEDCADPEVPVDPECTTECGDGDDQNPPCVTNCAPVVPENPPTRTRSSGSFGGGGGQVLGAKTGDVLGACVQFTEYHKKGDIGGEITMIQEFLNEELGLNLTVNGIYDQATFDAVKAFQAKYFSEIINPWFPALPLKVTGKWYKTTKMMANEIITCPEPAVFLEDPQILYKVKWTPAV